MIHVWIENIRCKVKPAFFKSKGFYFFLTNSFYNIFSIHKININRKSLIVRSHIEKSLYFS